MKQVFKDRMNVAATLTTMNPDTELAHAMAWLIEKLDKSIYEQKKRMLRNEKTY